MKYGAKMGKIERPETPITGRSTYVKLPTSTTITNEDSFPL